MEWELCLHTDGGTEVCCCFLPWSPGLWPWANSHNLCFSLHQKHSHKGKRRSDTNHINVVLLESSTIRKTAYFPPTICWKAGNSPSLSDISLGTCWEPKQISETLGHLSSRQVTRHRQRWNGEIHGPRSRCFCPWTPIALRVGRGGRLSVESQVTGKGGRLTAKGKLHFCWWTGGMARESVLGPPRGGSPEQSGFLNLPAQWLKGELLNFHWTLSLFT